MDQQYVFHPPNRSGFLFHLSAVAVLTSAGAWGLWRAFHTSVGPLFLLYLLPFIAALPLVPYLIFRLSGLENASYTLERDSIRLRWGLRQEVIPMVNVQWVHPASDLRRRLPLPPYRTPGAVTGTRRYFGAAPVIEYMASTTRDMLVIATPTKLYGISPSNPNEFLQVYQHFTEMGSLLPPPSESVHPTVLVTRLWQARPARNLILFSTILSFGLFVWVSFSITRLETVSLGITPSGAPRTPIPAIRLMLLPVLNSMVFLVDLLLGMVFFRRTESQHLAYLLWSTSIFVSVISIAAVYFILQISGSS